MSKTLIVILSLILMAINLKRTLENILKENSYDVQNV